MANSLKSGSLKSASWPCVLLAHVFLGMDLDLLLRIQLVACQEEWMIVPSATARLSMGIHSSEFLMVEITKTLTCDIVNS